MRPLSYHTDDAPRKAPLSLPGSDLGAERAAFIVMISSDLLA
jgi:hypothetical protein